MKRILLLCCFGIFAVGLSGCGGSTENAVIEEPSEYEMDETDRETELEMDSEEFEEDMGNMGEE